MQGSTNRRTVVQTSWGIKRDPIPEIINTEKRGGTKEWLK
jgi:hypothetical protein